MVKMVVNADMLHFVINCSFTFSIKTINQPQWCSGVIGGLYPRRPEIEFPTRQKAFPHMCLWLISAVPSTLVLNGNETERKFVTNSSPWMS